MENRNNILLVIYLMREVNWEKRNNMLTTLLLFKSVNFKVKIFLKDGIFCLVNNPFLLKGYGEREIVFCWSVDITNLLEEETQTMLRTALFNNCNTVNDHHWNSRKWRRRGTIETRQKSRKCLSGNVKSLRYSEATIKLLSSSTIISKYQNPSHQS